MVYEYLDDAFYNGCRNWDVVLSNCLSVVLVAALSCRSGDVHLSPKYDEKSRCWLRWEHIEITLKRATLRPTRVVPEGLDVNACIKDMRLSVELHYVKGHKMDKNTSKTRLLTPLDNPAFRHVDPCLLILINAQRQGQIDPDLRKVFAAALEHPHAQFTFAFPDRPVIPTRSKSNTHLKLDKPAKVHQPLNAMKSMGVISGVLGRVCVHFLRAGAARDVTHLAGPAMEGRGFTNDFTRQALGHTHESTGRGLTDDYSGDHTALLYNLRAVQPDYHDPKKPKFGPSKRERDEKNFEATTSDTEARSVLAPRDPNASSLVPPSAPRHGPDLPPPHAVPFQLPDNQSDSDDSMIDPRLRGNVEEVDVSQEQISRLESFVWTGDQESADGHAQTYKDSGDQEITAELEAADAFVLDLDRVTTTSESLHCFVERYASINVVKNDRWLQEKTRVEKQKIPWTQDTLALYPVDPGPLRGRDSPTPFVFECRKTRGCTFTTVWASEIAQHQARCDSSLVAIHVARNDKKASGDAYPCTHPGCKRVLLTEASRKSHMKKYHPDEDWIPKACEHGCNPKKIYDIKFNYDRHQKDVHGDASDRFPVMCSVVACTDKKKHHNIASYRKHLESVHNITSADELQKYLPMAATTSRWVREQPCLSQDPSCTATKFHAPVDMKRHLKEKHKMGDAAAQALVNASGRFEVVAKVAKVVDRANAMGVRASTSTSSSAKGKSSKEDKDARGVKRTSDGKRKA